MPPNGTIEVTISDAEFDLDMRVIEASFPIPVLACDTSDNCGSSCGGACATNVADPS
ncbi:FxLD family lanthipeptide [Nonomuraea basaltis]|uniref:FxLD family lanthipeptide n=1 Tax=Nonomuraea basaltis TaxID=2495887 RepID=UPI00110C4E6A|nr:FxLD family lanthipeptide [Nonomuraea basaltis]TMR90635.1 FxLD family lantipeptide [Nonomuraea basaltis]